MPQQPRDPESLAAELLASAAAADAEAVRTAIDDYLRTSGAEQIRTFIKPVVEEVVRAALTTNDAQQGIRANAVSEVLSKLSASLTAAKGEASSKARQQLTDEWTTALTSAATEAGKQAKVDLKPLRAAVRTAMDEEAKAFIEQFPKRLAEIDIEAERKATAEKPGATRSVGSALTIAFSFLTRHKRAALIVLVSAVILSTVNYSVSSWITHFVTALPDESKPAKPAEPSLEGAGGPTVVSENSVAIDLKPTLAKLGTNERLSACFKEEGVQAALKRVNEPGGWDKLSQAVRQCAPPPTGSLAVYLAQQAAVDYLDGPGKTCKPEFVTRIVSIDGLEGGGTNRLLNHYLDCRALTKPFTVDSPDDDYLTIARDAVQKYASTGGQGQ